VPPWRVAGQLYFYVERKGNKDLSGLYYFSDQTVYKLKPRRRYYNSMKSNKIRLNGRGLIQVAQDMFRCGFVRSEVLTAASMKMAVFWVVAPCSLVKVYRCFRDTCCHHHQAVPEISENRMPIII
jgi:hypothetical protein